MHDDHDLPPRLVPLAEAFRTLGVKYSKGYSLIREGQLEAVSLGSRTLIRAESLTRFMAQLPRANLKRGPRTHMNGGGKKHRHRERLLVGLEDVT